LSCKLTVTDLVTRPTLTQSGFSVIYFFDPSRTTLGMSDRGALHQSVEGPPLHLFR